MSNLPPVLNVTNMKTYALICFTVALFAATTPIFAQSATTATGSSASPAKSIIKIGKGGWTVNEADIKDVNDTLGAASFMGAYSEFADLLDADAIVLINDNVMFKPQAVEDVATRNHADGGWPHHNFRATKTTMRGSLATIEGRLYIQQKNGQDEYFAVKNTFVHHNNGWRLLISKTSTLKPQNNAT